MISYQSLLLSTIVLNDNIHKIINSNNTQMYITSSLNSDITKLYLVAIHTDYDIHYCTYVTAIAEGVTLFVHTIIECALLKCCST